MDRTRAVWQYWCRLWEGSCDLRPLALFRMGWALAVLVMLGSEPGRAVLYGPGRYHVPLLGSSIGPEEFTIYFYVTAVGAVMTLIGFWPRIGSLMVVLAHGRIFATDMLLFRNHAYLACLLGAMLACSPCGRAWSVDSLIHRVRGQPPSAPEGPRWSTQLIKGQILVVYVFAVLNKLNPSFLDGWVLESEMARTLPRSFAGALLLGPLAPLKPALDAILADPTKMAVLSWGALILEASVAVCLVFPRLFRYGAAIGLALHGGILLTMNVVAFGVLMVSSYPLFRPPRRPAVT